MNALVFLFIVLVVSGIGSAILWYQHRSPNTLESGIEAFQREIKRGSGRHVICARPQCLLRFFRARAFKSFET